MVKKKDSPGGGGGIVKGVKGDVVYTGASISRIMLWPSRKINLGNYNTADLNAGLEIVFDKPVAFNSKELKEAFEKGRKVIREEFIEQYKPYLKNETVNKAPVSKK